MKKCINKFDSIFAARCAQLDLNRSESWLPIQGRSTYSIKAEKVDPETYESKSDCSWGLIHHQVMQHIDSAIASVLQNVDVNPKAQTIEALVDAIDAVEDLQATRYILLKYATNRLYSQVARENNEVADDVRPRLVPKSRIGNNAHVSLARDIYDPFMYICGAQNVFPKNILRA